MRKSAVFTILALAISLTACSKKDGENLVISSATAAVAPDNSRGITKDKYGNPIFSRKPLLPLNRYVMIDRSQDSQVRDDDEKVYSIYRNAFWAGVSSPDHDLLAYDFLKEVRTESDTFKRQDLAKQNRTKLTAAYQSASSNKLFAVYNPVDKETSVGKFDPALKGFPLGFNIDQKDGFGWKKPNEGNQAERQWGIVLVGADSGMGTASVYIPKDNAEARTIESKLATLRKGGDYVRLPTYYIGHIAAAVTDPGPSDFHAGILVVDGVAVADPQTKEVLFTFDLNSRGKTVEATSFEIKRSVFPADYK